jgi:hypothetical protein
VFEKQHFSSRTRKFSIHFQENQKKSALDEAENDQFDSKSFSDPLNGCPNANGPHLSLGEQKFGEHRRL